jgi:hypothetical protein
MTQVAASYQRPAFSRHLRLRMMAWLLVASWLL